MNLRLAFGGFALGILVGVMLCAGALVIGVANEPSGRAPDPIGDSRKCYGELVATGKFITTSELHDAVALCSERLSYAYALNDYAIRRSAFLAQKEQGKAIAILVMVITLSGVGMAGFQMVTASRLAEREGSSPAMESSSLSIEAGKLSVQTSVTGILVLALSLAFFTVYVLNVYKLEHVKAGEPPVTTPRIRPELGVGVPDGPAEPVMPQKSP